MFFPKKGLRNQKGQALLIIVLVMVVALTVGLSVASRTIINLRNTQEQASSQKALSAAEAGVEQAIKTQAHISVKTFDSGRVSYSTTKTDLGNTSLPFLIAGKNQVSKNDAVYVWLSPYTSNFNTVWPTSGTANLTIYWGENSDGCSNAALEIAVITGPKSDPKVTRYANEPCGTRQGTNNFNSVSSSVISPIDGVKLYYKVDIPISNGLLVRVVPLYTNSYIGVSGNNLPQQGTIYTSTGIASDNNITRKITVFQGYPEVPAEFFPYILFQP